MKIPVVLNKRGPLPIDLRNVIYIGRPTKFGNPFSHLSSSIAKFQVKTRAESIMKYAEWLMTQPSLVAAARRELRGKDLLCWCEPLPCHGRILIEIANGCDCGFEDGGHEPDCYEVIRGY